MRDFYVAELKFECILQKRTADIALHLVTSKIKRFKTSRQQIFPVVKKPLRSY